MKELKTLVPDYAKLKEEYDNLKKEVDEKNKQIKELMAEAGLDKVEVDGYKASVSTSVRTTFNEDEMVKILKSYQISDPIYTKECIDMDKLESMIYNGELSKPVISKLAKCKNEKEVITLRVTN